MKYLIVIVFVFSISISAQKGKINFELDHINVIVKDLKETEYYLNDKLGFAVKPGKLHENTIENIFIKFSDKSYIEFLTVSKAKDELSKYYLRLKKEFPGGKSVFLFLRINTPEELNTLERNILQSGIDSFNDDIGYANIISFDDDDLYNISIIYYKSLIEDLPKHLIHQNSANSLNSVFIDINNSDIVIKKLKLLGLDIKNINQIPLGDLNGFKSELKNKPIYFSNFPGENFIYGISVGVVNINNTLVQLANKINYNYDLLISDRGSRTLLSPTLNFGMWLEFLQNK